MTDRYDERHNHRPVRNIDRDPALREQRAGSWRDEGPRENELWGQPEGFTDPRDSHGIWSAAHGGYTDQGYGGAMDTWRERRPGQYTGRGPKNYRRSDDRIREDVNERLTVNPDVDATNIEVLVRECEVWLDGTVETRDEKRKAEDCAWSVPGVQEVNNRLKVNVQDPFWGRR